MLVAQEAVSVLTISLDGTIVSVSGDGRLYPSFENPPLAGSNLLNLVAQEYRQPLSEAISHVCDSRLPQALQLDVNAHNASVISSLCVISPIIENGEATSCSIALVDDTMRRSASEIDNRIASQNATMAEISLIMSSSLDIDEVYEQFAERVNQLIPSDRISIASLAANVATLWRTHGSLLAGRRALRRHQWLFYRRRAVHVAVA